MNSLPQPARLVVCISGSGTNLQAIIDAIQADHLPAEIVLVVSNRRDAFGLTRAARVGIPTLYLPLKPYLSSGEGRKAYDAALAAHINPYRPDLLVLVGWMHILSPVFLEQFPGQVLNLHPALPGAFPGTHAIERAYRAYQRGDIAHSGCMVHYAVPEVDAGPTIAQVDVPIYPHDTLERFEQRMHEAEHRLIVEAIRIAIKQL